MATLRIRYTNPGTLEGVAVCEECNGPMMMAGEHYVCAGSLSLEECLVACISPEVDEDGDIVGFGRLGPSCEGDCGCGSPDCHGAKEERREVVIDLDEAETRGLDTAEIIKAARRFDVYVGEGN
jgi:hypothetical protein